MTLNHLSEMI